MDSGNSRLRSTISYALAKVGLVCGVGLFIGNIPNQASLSVVEPIPTGVVPAITDPGMPALPSQCQPNAVYEKAQQFTVRVFSDNSQGSGILIRRQGQLYTVLTNRHVLEENAPYQVQMSDQQVYSAWEDKAVRFGLNDLALVQFRSVFKTYNPAALASSKALSTGETVYATGFPVEIEDSLTSEIKFTCGQVSFILDKALEGGYQVGYTNDIWKGMSGGPVLNSTGEVVAVNGMHAYPLWGDPYIYQDGSKPSPRTRELLIHSSWAIPIEKVTVSLSQFKQ